MNTRGQIVLDFLRWADENNKSVALCRTNAYDRPFANDMELLHEWEAAVPPWTPTDLNPIFCKVEEAIDAHPKLRRITKENPVMAEPEISASRFGWIVTIFVKLEGSRKKAFKISGQGESPQEAAEKLVSSLDFWVQAV